MRLRLVALVVVSVVLGLAADRGSRAAACDLVPQLRDVTVNQGLGSYDPLVRGKETLVRYYLSKPSCATTSSSIAITGATMAVTSGAATLATVNAPVPALRSPYPVVAPYKSAPSLDSPADPKFVVPGSSLTPAPPDSRFTANFSVTLTYQSKTSSGATPTTGTVTFTNFPGTSSPIVKLYERRSGALRVLVVPMVFGANAAQFTDAGRRATQDAMLTLGRIFPVPDGVGDLAGAGGIRYTINPGFLDLTRAGVSGSTFCGSSANFNAIKAELAAFLGAWNQANPGAKADQVLGVVDQSISLGSGNGCAEGMASTASPEAWVRAVSDQPGAPSPTGATAAMELAHTLSLVLVSRDNNSSPYHSASVAADGTAPNRGYNVTTRAFLADDHSVMRVSGTWNNTNTLFEKADYAFFLCRIGGQTNAECSQSATIGTTQNVPAGPAFVLRGSTDGTAAGTEILSSHFSALSDLTEPDDASDIRFVQYDEAAVLSDLGVPVSFGETIHDGSSPEGGTSDVSSLLFAFPFAVGADRIELLNRHTSEVLYARTKGTAPAVSGLSGQSLARVSVTSLGLELNQHHQLGAGGRVMTNDHRYVVFSGGDLAEPFEPGTPHVMLRDRQLNETQQIASFGSEAQITPDGRFVLFLAYFALVPEDTNGVADVYVYDRQSVTYERISVDSAEVEGNATVIGGASMSNDGRYVAFGTLASNFIAGDATSSIDVFLRDRSLGTTTPLSVNAAGAATGGSFPSVSGDGRYVAYSANVLGGTGILVYDRQTGTRQRVDVSSAGVPPVGPSSSLPSISTDGRLVAFASFSVGLVPGDTNGTGDIFVHDRDADGDTVFDEPGGITTERVSVDSGGGQANGSSFRFALSASGSAVAFVSSATNLVSGDTNGKDDAFVHDRTTGETQRASVAVGGGNPDNYSQTTGISPDGRFVVFDSFASNLVPGDGNGTFDVFVFDRQASSGGDVVSTSDEPANLRLELYCETATGISYPLAIGLPPDAIDAGSATFGLPFDPALAGSGCVTVTALVDDGFTQSEATPGAQAPVDPEPRPPTAEILAPELDQTFLQFDLIALAGSCKDPEDGEIEALAWSSDLAGLSGNGTRVDASPPVGGWTPGDYTVDVSCQDSAGAPAQATLTLRVLADADNDGVSAPDEAAIGTSDEDPLDSFGDFDGDGLTNVEDPHPSTPDDLDPHRPADNLPPSVDAGTAADGEEGDAIPLDGTVEDQDGDTVTVAWTSSVVSGVDAGATCSFTAPTAVDTSIRCTDDGTFLARLTASDGVNDPVEATVQVVVRNAAPAISSFTGTDSLAGPLAFAPSGFTTAFSDPGTNDTWRTAFSFPAAQSVDPFASGQVVTRQFTGRACGVAVSITVRDDDGGEDSAQTAVDVGGADFLPPLTNAPVTDRVKNGRVVPVTVRIVDCAGAFVPGLQPAIRVREGDATPAPDDAVVAITPPPVSGADTSGVMREEEDTYVYNLRISFAKLNTDYTVIIYPYGIGDASQTLRHVMRATK